MKHFLFLISLIVLNASILLPQPATFYKSDIEKLGITDSVKSIREIIYSVPDKQYNMGFNKIISDEMTIYNEDGYALEKYTYKNGLLFSVIINEYDTNNYKIVANDFNENGAPYLTINYSIDVMNYQVTEIYDRSLQKMFDYNRIPIEVEYEKYYSTLYTKVVSKYSFVGRLLRKEYYKPDGCQSARYEFRYDYKGRKASAKYYNAKNKLSWERKYSYNAKNEVEVCKYFIKFRLGMVSKFEYEFDQKENWIKKTEKKDIKENLFTDDLDNSIIITTREIDYFND